MIFVRDRGQMCNNIFQYIQLYAWGREHGRKTMSMRFAYKYPDFAISRYPYHSFFFYFLAKVLTAIRLLPTVDYDKITSLEEGLEHIRRHRHCMVVGWAYIRLPELVDKYLPEIQQMFAFNAEVQDTVSKWMDDDIINIGVHIRRGDYKTFKDGFLYFSDEEFCRYVNKLLSLLPAEKKVRVYVCTNDMALDKSFYEKNVKASVTFSKGSAVEDLCLLSRCNYIIGPVSSYSLIAAMYGKARLFWMMHHTSVEQLRRYVGEENMSLDSFGSFSQMSRLLDYGFITK